ncbi:molybdopterin-binding protein [Haloarcula onubensis]|uniref:Molybdopterin-binding protein n=1 Tax=Haloarcula onubensis TaxID=2950539 RepID=A0ABU2FRM3_9EURY|nr:molybdopterin-binding protein [Halomicroarcula sp. S3CR25-11]MDS0283419.1 molybdopterin-binding protein [Halomicroarcula sp. S3CR25-11]
MVDFQSRDTRRGPTTDDESEAGSASSDAAASGETDDAEAAGATGDASEGNGSERAGDTTAEETVGEPADGPDPLAEERGSAADSDPVESEAGAEDPLAVDPADEGATVSTDETVEGNNSDPLADPDEAGDEGSSDPLGDAGEAGANPADEAVAATGSEQSAAEPPASAPAAPSRAVDVAVVTVAGDRASLEDTVAGAFETAGHAVVRRERLRGGYDGVQQMVETLVGQAGVDVVVTVGGVGLAADELTIEAVHPLLEKALPGFGEAFRSLLADHIGTGIVGVRSAAGVSDGTLVFCLPGDADAAGLAVREILATEAPVLLDQLDG